MRLPPLLTSVLSTTPVELFVFSAILLFAGLLYLIWANALHLSFLDRESLQSIERRHPYLPSLRIALGIIVCTAALFAVSLQSLEGFFPFDGPYGWLYLATFFTLLCSAGVLAETTAKGAGEYAFAFTVATAISFVFLVLRHTIVSATGGTIAALLLLLLSCLVVARLFFYTQWSRKAKIVALLTFILWILVYMRM